MTKRFFLGAILLSALTIFSSCTKSLGYSVVLWSNPEHNLADGQIVKVHIRSNILHEYVITTLDSEEKFEVPTWQLTEPTSKSKAKAMSMRFSEFEHTYARVKLDGLPIRAETVNTSKQVYRLRENEIIRILSKGNGQGISNEDGAIEGDWYKVLTETGTQGWCFSHNLDFFQAGIDVKASVALETKDDDSEKNDETLAGVLSKRWYPEEFKTMIQANRIDLERMDASFGFDFGSETGKTSLLTADDTLYWEFEGISKLFGKQYQIDGTKINVTVRNENLISVQYFDAERKIKVVNFVSFDDGTDVEKIIQDEKSRRENVILQIVNAGPNFASSSYGRISFSPDGRVSWLNNDLLIQQGLIDSAHANSALVSVEYFISESLKSSYDGVLTFRFGGVKEVNFFYKLTNDGLRLEDAVRAEIKDGEKLFRSAGNSFLVMFFERT